MKTMCVNTDTGSVSPGFLVYVERYSGLFRKLDDPEEPGSWGRFVSMIPERGEGEILFNCMSPASDILMKERELVFEPRCCECRNGRRHEYEWDDGYLKCVSCKYDLKY